MAEWRGIRSLNRIKLSHTLEDFFGQGVLMGGMEFIELAAGMGEATQFHTGNAVRVGGEQCLVAAVVIHA